MSSPDTSALFRPFAIKGLEVKNRVVMSPINPETTNVEGVAGPPAATEQVR